ncbi:hypothetical protein SESBI_28013 [Sesbania bispinosa]|nr:hypothetical protein SESBI_28013 [Sesbania bispinosa]
MSRDYVFSIEELSDPEVAVVKALQAFREEHGILGCHRILNGGGRSLKDRLGDMAGNNMLALAEKRAKREAAKRAAADAERAVATGAGSSALTSSKAVTQCKSFRTSNAFRCLFFPKDILGTPDPEEDAAMKLLGQQGQRVFTGSSAAEMKDFLGQVGTWCLRGAMMAEFFHSTIDEVAALPQIKRDFEAVSKKLKDDEVVMQDALKKVKGLSDDNIRLTDKNKELEEEIKKLKSDLDTKRSEAIQAVLEKQKMAEDLEGAREEWKIKFLNPGVDLRTRGMSTLCVVRDGKWYRGTGKFFVEEDPSEVEIAPPPMHPLILEADIASGDMKGPSESEMVDAQILGLETSLMCDATVLPDVQDEGPECRLNL